MKKNIFIAIALLPTAFCYSQVDTLFYTGAVQTYTVPACVTSITVDISGGQGGNVSNLSQAPNKASGGLGGRVQATIPVTYGTVLQINVGGVGQSDGLTLSCQASTGGFNGGGTGYGGYNSYNYNAGGGGGASDIRVFPYNLSNVLVVAGGGGGAACTGCTGGGVTGGPGGGLTGGNGSGGSCSSLNKDYGFGGTQLKGGDSGTFWGKGTAGTLGMGGLASPCCGVTCGGGGGGGGGYYGGGGGSLAGGGGGSSYTIATATGVTHTQGYRNGSGMVIITPNFGFGITISQTNIKCFGSGNTGSATASSSCGTSPYTYLWSPGGSTNATISNLSAGTYKVVIKDKTGAKDSSLVNIIEPAQLRDSIKVFNIPCNGGSNGSETAEVKGGTSPYTYSWTNGATGATASNLTVGCYTLTVTDNSGCTATANACITQPTQLRDSIKASTNISCYAGNNGSATVGVKGGTVGYTYSWAPVGGTSATISNLTAGCYTVTVADANGCIVTASTCLTQPTQLRDSIKSSTNISCNGGNNGTATVGVKGGTGAYTYLWTPAGQTTSTITGLTVGCYTVTVTDANGCFVSANTCITQPTVLSATTSAATTICSGTCVNITVTGSGGSPTYSYSWSTGNTTTTVPVCPTATSTYTVTLSDANGCTTTATVKVTIHTSPTLTIGIAKDTACINWTTDVLTGNPLGGTFSGSGVTGTNFNPNTAGLGIHKILYAFTDTNGCIDKDSINVIVSNCTGIQEVSSLENQIKFYPNPFSESVNVNVTIDDPVTITMFDILGENVGTWTLNKGLNTISTKSIPSGIYFIQAKTKNGLLNKKLVKEN